MPSEIPDAGSYRLQIDERIDHFSITVLGYDRDSGDTKPSVLLKYVKDNREREAARRKRFGAIVTACGTAILGAVAWPVIQHFFHLGGP